MKGSGRPSDQLPHHLKIMWKDFRERFECNWKSRDYNLSRHSLFTREIWNNSHRNVHLTSFRVHISEDANEKDKKERLLEAESRSHALASASSKLTKTGEQLALLRRRKYWANRIGSPHQSMSIEINPLAIPWKTKPPTAPAEIQHFITRRSDHRVGHMNMIKYDHRVISKCS